MTEQLQEQISVFVDDELSADECEFFVRRLQREPESRSRLIRYHMIGAAIRGELCAPDAGQLRRRLQDALDGAVRPREASSVRAGFLRVLLKPVAGVGIAAGVAAVALLAIQSAREGGGLGLEVPAAGPAIQAGQADAPSYVVPPKLAERRLVSPDIQLTNYLMRHGEYASHLSRTSVHSNVVATGQADPIADDIEEDGEAGQQ
jgi:negative regulator of sigma E activity